MLLLGCDSGRVRPVGFFHLGKVADLFSPETRLAQTGLVLRHDANGFWVMSTYSTYDLSPLEWEKDGREEVLVSPRNGGRYSADGSVLTEPMDLCASLGSTRQVWCRLMALISGRGWRPWADKLPFYKLRLDSSDYGGIKDSLYVEVGVERPQGWRLKVTPRDPAEGAVTQKDGAWVATEVYP